MNEVMEDVMRQEDQLDQLPTVVVTGFGIFRNYSSNPSWDCVQRLSLKDVTLITLEIPVAYDEVDKQVAIIWNRYKPMLVIHCGVSCAAKCITLETRAVWEHRLYEKADIKGQLPDGTRTTKPSDDRNCQPLTESNDNDDCLECSIDLEGVCNQVNQHFHNGFIAMPATLSANAGRYLCEYIFSSSLRQSRERTVFIHVPEVGDNCSLDDMTASLQFTIQTIVNMVLKQSKQSSNDM